MSVGAFPVVIFHDIATKKEIEYMEKQVLRQVNIIDLSFLTLLGILSTPGCQIVVQSRLFFWEEKSHLHELIRTYTFINFEDFFLPTRLLSPTRLLILRIFYCLHTRLFSLLNRPFFQHSHCILKVLRKIPTYMIICSFLHDYIFLSNFPTYMFIQTYMIIYFLINFPTYTFIQAYTIINF